MPSRRRGAVPRCSGGGKFVGILPLSHRERGHRPSPLSPRERGRGVRGGGRGASPLVYRHTPFPHPKPLSRGERGSTTLHRDDPEHPHPGHCAERPLRARRGRLHDDLQRRPGAEPRPRRLHHARRLRLLLRGAGARPPQGGRLRARGAHRGRLRDPHVRGARSPAGGQPDRGGDIHPDPRRRHAGPDHPHLHPGAEEHVGR